MAKIATHHVHFPDDQASEHISEISVESDDNAHMIINVGFLKVNHQYSIRCQIKDNLGPRVFSDPNQNERVRIVEAIPTEDGKGHEILVELKACREKLIEEEVMLNSSINPANFITLAFQASVLGTAQGTPALRNGVHCTASFEEKVPIVLGMDNSMDSSIDDASECLS